MGEALTIQRMIKNKNYDQAESKMLQLQTHFPNISHFHALMGAIHFLKNEPKKSKAELTRAIELNAENLEAKALLNKIEASTK